MYKDRHLNILIAELQQMKQVLPTINHDNNTNNNNHHDNHNRNNNNYYYNHMKISGDGQRKEQGRQRQ